MNVVDSSAWLEYLADGPTANAFAPAVQKPHELIVPTISIYEVFKKVLSQRNEDAALQAISLMGQGTVVDLDTNTALQAAKLSLELKLPMADSIMLATARAHDAILWTQDADFEGIPGVKYHPKKDKRP